MRLRALLATTGLAAGTAVASLVGAPAAGAAGDTTPPTVVLGAPAFVVGSTIGASRLDGEVTDGSYTRGIAQRVTWRASDAGGVCSADVQRTYAGSAPSPVAAGATGAVVTAAEDYDGSLGGGSSVATGWEASARDCAGNEGWVRRLSRVGVLQEDSRSATLQEPRAVRRTGAWRTSTCTCWSGGTAASTTQQGASATLTRRYAAGAHVALVAATGPDRGAVRIAVDGRVVATVDTRSDARASRVVVWERAVGAGAHTVEVTALGTPGRPRVDVDAFLVS